jgi:hypothetical protein
MLRDWPRKARNGAAEEEAARVWKELNPLRLRRIELALASACSTCWAALYVMPNAATFERVLHMGQLLPLANVLPQAHLLNSYMWIHQLRIK